MRQKDQDNDDGASLLPAGAISEVNTETLPNYEKCCKCERDVMSAAGTICDLCFERSFGYMAGEMPSWRIRQIAEQALLEATAATNALACLARAQYHHAEVSRLHTAIGLLKEQLGHAER